MKLNEIKDKKSARKKYKRLGRGVGSGKGETAARGFKGQKARSGVAVRSFEGGQTPIYQRLPKRGFKSLHKDNKPVAINIYDLDMLVKMNLLKEGDEVTAAKLAEFKLIKASQDVKLLSKGELSCSLKINVKCSEAAKSKLAKSGSMIA
jgi:large subunit ribosomal protein L15